MYNHQSGCCMYLCDRLVVWLLQVKQRDYSTVGHFSKALYCIGCPPLLQAKRKGIVVTLQHSICTLEQHIRDCVCPWKATITQNKHSKPSKVFHKILDSNKANVEREIFCCCLPICILLGEYQHKQDGHTYR